jgi:hypothetical protein
VEHRLKDRPVEHLAFSSEQPRATANELHLFLQAVRIVHAEEGAGNMNTEAGRRLIEKAEPHAVKRKRQEERSADKHREHENKKRKSLEAKLTREQHRKGLRALCASVVSQHKQRRAQRQSSKASKTARKAAPAQQQRKPFPPPPSGVPQTTITSASTTSRAARQPQTKSNLRRAFARLCGRGCAARASAWGVGLLLWRVGVRATRVKARPLLWLYSLLIKALLRLY